MPVVVPHRELEALESRVQAALRSADGTDLDVLGYGEVTLVLRLRTDRGAFACKRLPLFPTGDRLLAYAGSLEEYLDRLREGGLRVAETALWHTVLPTGQVAAYCVQEALPTQRLCSRLLQSEPTEWADGFFKRFLDRVDGVVGPRLGLDAQASNWVDVDGELVYLDVTTPLMRDERGRERLDTRLFFTSLPWAVRDAVRLSVSSSIFEKFYSTRGVVLDFLGNLHKERLDRLIPGFLAQANERLDAPLQAAEVSAYYRSDARMWELIQRLRQADRSWQRRVRRRPYPFLLPPPVDR